MHGRYVGTVQKTCQDVRYNINTNMEILHIHLVVVVDNKRIIHVPGIYALVDACTCKPQKCIQYVYTIDIPYMLATVHIAIMPHVNCDVRMGTCMYRMYYPEAGGHSFKFVKPGKTPLI